MFAPIYHVFHRKRIAYFRDTDINYGLTVIRGLLSKELFEKKSSLNSIPNYSKYQKTFNSLPIRICDEHL